MFSAVSNVLPVFAPRGGPVADSPVQASPTPTPTAATVESPRAATGPEERNNAGRDPDRPLPQGQEGSEEDARGLTEEEQSKVEELRARDAEVRAHELAHAAAGGSHAGAPNYDYERGPDGRMYAVGGHVNIDVSEVPGDPEATLRKMRQIQRAALAPAEPSGQDRKVAAEASAKASKAQREMQENKADELQGEDGTSQDASLAPPSGGSEPPNSPPDAPGTRAGTTVRSLESKSAYQFAGTRGETMPRMDLMA